MNTGLRHFGTALRTRALVLARGPERVLARGPERTPGAPLAVRARTVPPSFVFRRASPSLLVSLSSVLALGGCFRSETGSCDPFHPPPPHKYPNVSTKLGGAISVTLDGSPAAVALNGPQQPSGPSCSAEIDGSPSAQRPAIGCSYAPAKLATWESITFDFGHFDLRTLAPGELRARVTVGVMGDRRGSCSATIDGTITITEASGSSAPAPSYVTPDFVRKGVVSLNLDAATSVAWTPNLYPCNAAPRLAASVSATFTQLPADYAEISAPSCNLDISK